MINIFKMRLMHFRRNYQIFVIMTLLTLAFVFVFNLSGYDETVHLGWLTDQIGEDYGAYEQVLTNMEGVSVVPLSLLEGEASLADMKLDFLIAMREGDNGLPLVELYSLVEDMSHVAAQNRLEGQISEYFSTLKWAKDIQVTVATLVPEVTVGDEAMWLAALEKNMKSKATATLQVESVGSSIWEGYNNKLHNLMGFGLMFSMFTLVFSVSDVLTDMKNHSWGRLNTAPMNTLSILVGYFAPSVLLGFFQLSLLVVSGVVLFQIDFGRHLPSLFLFLFLFSLTIACLGVLLAGLLRTRGQVGAVSAVLISGTSMLGGCMWPLTIVNSEIMLLLSLFVPQRWALEAIEGLTMYNMAPALFIKQAGVLLFMSLLFLGGGLYFFTKSKSSQMAG